MKIKNKGQALINVGKHTILPDEVVEIEDSFRTNSVIKLLLKRGEMLEVLDGEQADEKVGKKGATKGKGKADKDDSKEDGKGDGDGDGKGADATDDKSKAPDTTNLLDSLKK